jgi:hypothetical protein
MDEALGLPSSAEKQQQKIAFFLKLLHACLYTKRYGRLFLNVLFANTSIF